MKINVLHDFVGVTWWYSKMRCRTSDLILWPYLSLCVHIWDWYPLVTIFEYVTQAELICEIYWDKGVGSAKCSTFSSMSQYLSLIQGLSSMYPIHSTGDCNLPVDRLPITSYYTKVTVCIAALSYDLPSYVGYTNPQVSGFTLKG